MKITVNNTIVKAKEGQTILEVLKENGIKVPTLCHMDGLFPSGACRMCVVELADSGKLVPSCATGIQDGMSVLSHSPKVLNARKTITELLLANHPDDCLYCEKNEACELQDLSVQLGVKERHYSTRKKELPVDRSSASIIRDPDKCILCGRCVRMCEEIQDVSAIDFTGRGSSAMVGPAFNQGLNVSTCINCGQCINVCPTGALTEQNHIKEVLQALQDPEKTVIIQHAPAISVTLGEYYGYKPGNDVAGRLNAALRRAGFDRVFDTSFTADLTIMEEASEFVHRVTNNGPLPLLTSCSPGWIKYVEQFYPEFIENLSTCKSPQQMMGAVIKNFYAAKAGIDPASIYTVSIMPCTAKKYEAAREEMISDGNADIDAVLTTRELDKFLKMMDIDLSALTPEDPDDPLGERSSAGKIFGVTGGVMEAAVRTAHYLITGENPEFGELKAVRSLKGRKEAELEVNGIEIRVAVVNGLSNAREILEDVKAGRKQYHFIEVMTCPGGCIGGGGQPFGISAETLAERMKGLYAIDRESALRFSHENASIKKMYEEYFEKPLSHKSHKLLHTHYSKREGLY